MLKGLRRRGLPERLSAFAGVYSRLRLARCSSSFGIVIGFVGLLVFATTLFQTSLQAQTAPKIPITTVVTVLGPKFTAPPAISKEDVIVFSGKTSPLTFIDWVLAQGQKGGLQLAILIDNSASQFGVGTQLNELADFITLQPKSTAIGVFYAVNGTVQAASRFSRDHDAVAKTLRMPLGARAGSSPSVYLSLSDLIDHHWQPTGGRREVLLISSGVDRMDRGPESPYVRAAIEDAQKAGVVVHAIYTDGLSFDESMRGQFAQSNLVQLAEGSGGYNLFEGAPRQCHSHRCISKNLDAALRHQYRLTFTIEPVNKSKAELREITIRTEQHDVTLRYPKQVMVPGVAK